MSSFSFFKKVPGAQLAGVELGTFKSLVQSIDEVTSESLREPDNEANMTLRY